MQFDYKKTKIYWENKSSVRKTARRVVNAKSTLAPYPVNRQPLCIHPLVQQKGQDVIKFILFQSLYKFLYDIAIIEVSLVNKVADKIFHNYYKIKFCNDLRHDILTIIVDEAYHAYVALDFIEQIIDIFKIPPIIVPTETQLTKSVQYVKSTLDQDIGEIFELIAVCIAENSITKDLISLSKEKNLDESFSQILSDHMLDECRHNIIFKYTLEYIWFYLSDKVKLIIKNKLPIFIKLYLSNDVQKNYDKKILEYLNFTGYEIDTIIDDTHVSQDLSMIVENNSAAKNIIKLLKNCKVISDSEIDKFII